MNKEALFHAALAKPAAERAAYLDAVCAGQPELRAELDALLAAHDDSAELPPLGVGTGDFSPERKERPYGPFADQAGAVIAGRYTLLQKIGEGGMGEVWVAKQTEPVKRKVALKLIKAGMDSKAVLTRFEQERQALALMDHPNIAKVLDGGLTVDQRPFFVMELVNGLPLTQFCDEAKFTPRQRLELFVPVCQAVQHAHQKGIVHRDLKPTNILVTLYDGKPVPKVIDFGVAKATGGKLTDESLSTQFGAVVGTLEYMSPEQAGFAGHDIDTRADIYSLGVILYELLTGLRPFDRKRLQAAALDEVIRIIREEEPPHPATRLSTDESLPSLAAVRQMEPKRLIALMRGEPDWIVMKCLEKDRNRRYETASGLARDLERYLADEPVEARPVSAGYRLRKFVSRNQRGLLMAALAGLAVLLAVGSFAWMARQRSVQQRETEREVAVALAEAEMFDAAGWKQIDDPDRWTATVGLAQSAVQRGEGLLATGVATTALAEQVSRVRAAIDESARASRLCGALDRIRLDMAAFKEGGYDQAPAASRYAAVFSEFDIDPASPEAAAERVRNSPLRAILLAVMEDWARVSPAPAQQQQLAEVLRLAEPGPDAFRSRWQAARERRDGQALVELAREPHVQGLPAPALVTMAHNLAQFSQTKTAEHVLRDGQERFRNDFWLNHELGRILMEQQPPKAAEAVRYLTAALALRHRSPGPHFNLGNALTAMGEREAAVRCYRTAIDLDPTFALAHYNLGNNFAALRRFVEAEAAYRQALKFKPNDAQTHNNLGNVLQEQGNLAEAVTEFRRAIQLEPNLGVAQQNLGNALNRLGQRPEAIAECRRAAQLQPDSAAAHHSLGDALRDAKQYAEAATEYRRAVELKPDDPLAHHHLGFTLQLLGKFADAAAENRRAVELKPDFVMAHHGLGTTLRELGQLPEAAAAFERTIQLQPEFAEAHCNLGNVLIRQGRFREALASMRRGHEIGSKKPGWKHPSDVWVRQAQRWVELDAKLAQVLQGEAEPANTAEHLDLARFCINHKKLYSAAVRFYTDAFQAEPRYADDLRGGHRFLAATAAALAASGQGADAGKLGEAERAGFRRQALTWLRADLTARTKCLDDNANREFAGVRQDMEFWQQDSDFASVREAAALAKLPESERMQWQQLWADVENLRRRAAAVK